MKISQIFLLKHRVDIAVMLNTLGLCHCLRLVVVQRHFLGFVATESVQSRLMSALSF